MAPADLTADPLLRDMPVYQGYKVLGNIVLFQKLGQGGMGAVYRGRHLKFGTDVAVKVMVPPLHMSDDMQTQFVKRFLREAKVALSVTHPQLIRVFTVDSDCDVYYLVMDYIEGETAGERLKRKGPLSEGEALQICLGAAEGLAAAHQKGIVHRDIKPDNILIGKDGSIRVIDLGLAKAFGESEELTVMTEMTQSHQAMGTPQYMSLEQFESAKDVGPPADVWSLGVTLYHLLTDELPWEFTNLIGYIASVQRDQAVDVSAYRRDLSPGLRAILNKSIEKDISKRYQDCVEVRDAIKAHFISHGEQATLILEDPKAGSTKHALIAMEPPDERQISLIGQTIVAKPAGDTAKYPAVQSSEEVTVDMGRGVGRRRPSALKWAVPAVGVVIAAVVALLLLLGGGLARDRLASAKAAMSLGKYDAAIEALEKVLAHHPEDAEAARLMRSVRIAQARAEVMRLAGADDLDALEKALKNARHAGVEEAELKEASLVYKVKRGIEQIDAAIDERRFTRALSILEDLPDSHGLGMAGEISGRKTMIETALVRANTLLAALDIELEEASEEQLAAASKSLNDFESAFPHHPKKPQAVATRDRIATVLRTRASRTELTIETRPTGLNCKIGDKYLGKSTFTTDELPAGEHTIVVVDAEGFVSVHRVRVTAGRPAKELLDHAGAVAAEARAYRDVRSARDEPAQQAAACKAYLERFPSGAKRDEVNALFVRLSATLEAARRAAALRKTVTGPLGIEFVLIRGGQFMMGDGDGPDDSKPEHTVAVSGFYIGRYEVTKAQFSARGRMDGATPGVAAATDREPVVGVSWNEASAFCRRLASLDPGRAIYRLPTEAEWEYAARGARGRAYPWGEAAPRGEHANLEGVVDGFKDLAPVGSFGAGATPEGVMDLIGNAAEWCADWYGLYPPDEVTDPTGPDEGEKKVVRGSAYAYEAKTWSKPTVRGVALPDARRDTIGFRVVRELSDEEREAEKAGRHE
jgi:formylglycine-generating enzyme required for sulfatase activity/tRNA A-37 threonylcarbamoyl transferase component Bud32